MNEPAIRMEEQIISLFQDRETRICQGWILKRWEFSELTVVDFSNLAQGCKTYDEFIGKMTDVSETELNYFGIAICGGLLFPAGRPGGRAGFIRSRAAEEKTCDPVWRRGKGHTAE